MAMIFPRPLRTCSRTGANLQGKGPLATREKEPPGGRDHMPSALYARPFRGANRVYVGGLVSPPSALRL